MTKPEWPKISATGTFGIYHWVFFSHSDLEISHSARWIWLVRKPSPAKSPSGIRSVFHKHNTISDRESRGDRCATRLPDGHTARCGGARSGRTAPPVAC